MAEFDYVAEVMKLYEEIVKDREDEKFFIFFLYFSSERMFNQAREILQKRGGV